MFDRSIGHVSGTISVEAALGRPTSGEQSQCQPHPVPALDFAVQSKLALNRKVNGGAGHDDDLRAAPRGSDSIWYVGHMGGTARMVLAVVLLAAAGGVAYAATRLPLSVRPPTPGEGARTFMLVIWGFAIIAFLVCLPVYVKHARQEHLLHAAPPDPITPVTAICVGVIFIIIFIVGSSRGWRTALASAAIGAAAAPMIFEFPFDLIVMARTYPPLPPDPGPVPGPVLRTFVSHRSHNAVASDVVTHGEAVQSGTLFLRIDAGGFRILGLVRIRLSLHPGPHRPERGVEDPGLRRGPQPVPFLASPGQRARPAALFIGHGRACRPPARVEAGGPAAPACSSAACGAFITEGVAMKVRRGHGRGSGYRSAGRGGHHAGGARAGRA